MGQQDGQSQQMQPRQRFRQTLVVARQAPEPGHPGETALHYPVARQQQGAVLGRRQLRSRMIRYQFPPNPVCLSVPCRLLTGMALIDRAYSHRFARCEWDALGQRSDVEAVLVPRGRSLDVIRQGAPARTI